MSSLARRAPTDPDAFVAWENRQRFRYELIGGSVRMMTGGTLAHDRIAANVIASLHQALRGNPCAVHGSNLKVRSPVGAVMYPDAFVRCGPADDEVTEVDDPVLVLEVESPRTKRYDMNEKRWAYQAIPTLRHILLIATGRRLAELATRDGEGRWLSTLAQRDDARLSFEALGVSLTLAEIYVGTAIAG
jgi:Uma2 family endonuclease